MTEHVDREKDTQGSAGQSGWWRRTRSVAVAFVIMFAAGVAAAYQRWQIDREVTLRDHNIGRVAFELSVFDWDALAFRALPVPLADVPALTWTLHLPSLDDPDRPGEALAPMFVSRLGTDALSRRDLVEAPGGAAVLVITGRGRPGEVCAPALVPLRALPGYALRAAGPASLAIRIPSCRATRSDTIVIPAGPFVFGGPGEPPSSDPTQGPDRAVETEIVLPSYRIDRPEVTNAAFLQFSAMYDVTGIGPPDYRDHPALGRAGDPRSPATNILWREAAVYCRFLGKHLPSSAEWEKAMRGGISLAGDRLNPYPRRNFPWGTTLPSNAVNLRHGPLLGPQPVGSFSDDVSPYGVVDLAGNVLEWIGSAPTGDHDPEPFFRGSTRLIRGGDWRDTEPVRLMNSMVLETRRTGDTRTHTIGWRCAE